MQGAMADPTASSSLADDLAECYRTIGTADVETTILLYIARDVDDVKRHSRCPLRLNRIWLELRRCHDIEGRPLACVRQAVLYEPPFIATTLFELGSYNFATKLKQSNLPSPLSAVILVASPVPAPIYGITSPLTRLIDRAVIAKGKGRMGCRWL